MQSRSQPACTGTITLSCGIDYHTHGPPLCQISSPYPKDHHLCPLAHSSHPPHKLQVTQVTSVQSRSQSACTGTIILSCAIDYYDHKPPPCQISSPYPKVHHLCTLAHSLHPPPELQVTQFTSVQSRSQPDRTVIILLSCGINYYAHRLPLCQISSPYPKNHGPHPP